MDKLILENVRCFKGRHEIPLAPLTLLIGENSTGKSTLLSAVRLAWDICKGESAPNFNEQPFDWGDFEHIAHNPGKRGERPKHFSIGIKETLDKSKEGVFKLAKFFERNTQPQLSEWLTSWEPHKFHVNFNENGTIRNIFYEHGIKQFDLIPERTFLPQSNIITAISLAIQGSDFLSADEKTKLIQYLHNKVFEKRPYAFAPIRSKPERTYNRKQEILEPEGSHIPMILARIQTSQPEEWSALQNGLEKFGIESDLFSSIQIKTAFDTKGGPFEIQVIIKEEPVNLIDVGYGVSQVLPIIIESLLGGKEDQLLLMQQPETHLHPKAQAALGSFFGTLVKHQYKQMIIETHSDYLIDRIRMDVRDGKNLQAKDVIFLYFEREGSEVKIHPIELDSSGNLVNVPPGYRQFFLEEQERFLEG